MLDQLAAGDVVTVTRIGRLARSTFDLFGIVKRIVDAKAQFRSLAEPWAHTGASTRRLMLAVLGGLADAERDLIRTRTAQEPRHIFGFSRQHDILIEGGKLYPFIPGRIRQRLKRRRNRDSRSRSIANPTPSTSRRASSKPHATAPTKPFDSSSISSPLDPSSLILSLLKEPALSGDRSCADHNVDACEEPVSRVQFPDRFPPNLACVPRDCATAYRGLQRAADLQDKIRGAEVAEQRHLGFYLHIPAAGVHQQLNETPANVALAGRDKGLMPGEFLRHSDIAAGNGQSVPVRVQHTRAAARSSYPHHFRHSPCGIIQVLEHAIGSTGIERVVGEFQCQGISYPELRSREYRSRPLDSFGDQLLVRIDPDHPPRRADRVQDDLRIPAKPASHIQRRATGLQPEHVYALALHPVEQPRNQFKVASHFPGITLQRSPRPAHVASGGAAATALPHLAGLGLDPAPAFPEHPYRARSAPRIFRQHRRASR
jgi:hypothetical protein